MNRIRGNFAEDYACNFLLDRGYKILERNYNCRQGELDIVAEKDSLLVVVEVKARRLGAKVSALESVAYKKILRIIRATEDLLRNRQAFTDKLIRFDIIGIEFDSSDNVVDIVHYVDAFSSIDYV